MSAFITVNSTPLRDRPQITGRLCYVCTEKNEQKREIKNDEKFHRNSYKLFMRVSMELFIIFTS